jgi:hypothetical protein
MTVRNLDAACHCGRISGDHSLREWAACLGATAMDLPYEEVPGGPVDVPLEATGRVMADNVVARSAVVEQASGPVKVRIPVLVLTFGVNFPGEPPRTVAEVALIAGDGDGMRRFGKLFRDTANGAANAIGRTR